MKLRHASVSALLAMAAWVVPGCATVNARRLREFVRVDAVVAASEPAPGKFLVAVAFTDGTQLLYHLREGDDRTERLLEPIGEWDGAMPPSLAVIEIAGARSRDDPREATEPVEVRTADRPRLLRVDDDGLGFVVSDEADQAIAMAWIIDGKQLDWSRSGNWAYAALIVPAVAVDILTAPLQAIVAIWFVASGNSIG